MLISSEESSDSIVLAISLICVKILLKKSTGKNQL
jgi:hypothetical protein